MMFGGGEHSLHSFRQGNANNSLVRVPEDPPEDLLDAELEDEEGQLTQPPQDQNLSFPVRLHYMLCEIQKEGLYTSIVSWQPHGRCFLVHNKKKFVEGILCLWFRQSKWESFQRQLNLYGFQRLSRGPDKGGYYHKYFLQSKPDLAKRIMRQKLKGKGPRKPAQPEAEPNFYKMEPMVDNDLLKKTPAASGVAMPTTSLMGPTSAATTAVGARMNRPTLISSLSPHNAFLNTPAGRSALSATTNHFLLPRPTTTGGVAASNGFRSSHLGMSTATMPGSTSFDDPSWAYPHRNLFSGVYNSGIPAAQDLWASVSGGGYGGLLNDPILAAPQPLRRPSPPDTRVPSFGGHSLEDAKDDTPKTSSGTNQTRPSHHHASASATRTDDEISSLDDFGIWTSAMANF